jgi:class 3 adenylate cyclase/tetratricopeptide (TPR) repeat protein
VSSCPACGHANEDGAKFCSECGAALATKRAVTHEERKVVTALFVDLVGFTSRSEQLDPEDVRALLSPYYARLRSELERFGGTVEKFIGDAVMALFGAPVSHEDDPERAVRAALAIRDWVRGEDAIQVRIAVNTGEALVTLGARPSEGEGMAAGDVINTAARLQSAAPVNGVLVGERTYRATSRVIDYAVAEPVTAKGKEQSVPAWEALQPRSRFGVDVPDVARAALVGRERELAVLRDSLSRMRVERAPQLLTLIGVPGIGKSRLLYELSELVDEESDIISWRQGRSLPYGEGVSFWALAEIMKAQAGILDSDASDVTERKLAEAVTAALPDGAEAEWVQRHLRELVGVRQSASGGTDARDEVFAAWRRFLEALAEQRPLVLVFEDLHWADDGLLDFVDLLVDWVTDVPLLVVCSARPELLARRPDWGGGKPNASTLSLAPLSDDDTSRLISALLDRPLLRAEQQQELLLRAAGNPLFAEQYVQMLSEHDVGKELPVPETVQDLVVARLDALPLQDKRLLQDAAVIGKVFWAGALTALAEGEDDRADLERRLHDLSRRQFVRRERRSSLSGEDQYAFLHVLLRDFAYGQMPRGVRADKHIAAARWIESLGRADDFAEMLAHHYLTALELMRATGQSVDRVAGPARSALNDAGRRALALNAFSAAATYFQAALDLWPDDEAGHRARLMFQLAVAHAGDEVDPGTDELEQALDALLAAGLTAEAAEVEARLGRLWWFRGQRDRSTPHLRHAEELVRDQPGTPHKAFVLSEVARCRMLTGDNDLETATAGLRIAEDLGLDDLRAHQLITIGTVEAREGKQGIDRIRAGLDLALAGNHLRAAVRGYSNLATLLDNIVGDQREIVRISQESLDLATRMGSPGNIRWTQGNHIQAVLETGDWTTALRMSDEFIAESARSTGHNLDSHVLSVRGWLRLARGDVAGAVADQEEAIAKARLAKDPQTFIPALTYSANILAATGDMSTAGRRIDELLALDEPVVDYLGQGVVDFVLAADALGRRDDLGTLTDDGNSRPWVRVMCALATGDAETALELLDSMHAERSAALTRLQAARARAAAGDSAGARDVLQKSLEFFQRVDAVRFIREAEALLPASA